MNKVVILLMISSLCITGCATTMLKSSDTPQVVQQNMTQANALGYFLPKGMIRIANHNQKGEKEWLWETFLVPDPAQFYTLQYLSNSCSDDTIDITLSQAGLLQEVKVSAKERTADIIAKVIEIGKEAAKLAAFPAATLKPAEAEKYLDITIDPDVLLTGSQEDKERLGQLLKQFQVEVELRPLDPGGAPQVTRGPLPQRGIYFRPLLPYEITIKHWEMVAKNKSTGESTESAGKPKGRIQPLQGPKRNPESPLKKEYVFVKRATIFLPNGAPILSLDITRAPFVKKDTTLTFKDGILTVTHIDKPSEFLAAMEIPLNLVKAIVAIPGELVKFKYDYSVSNAKLIRQQLDEMKAQQELDDYLKGLKEKKKKNGPIE